MSGCSVWGAPYGVHARRELSCVKLSDCHGGSAVQVLEGAACADGGE